jgi:hypothetical protein
MTRRMPGALAALSLLSLAGPAAARGPAVKSVDFIGMPPPSTVEERADVYGTAQIRITYTNGRSRTFDLRWGPILLQSDRESQRPSGVVTLYPSRRSPGAWISFPAPGVDQYGRGWITSPAHGWISLGAPGGSPTAPSDTW